MFLPNNNTILIKKIALIFAIALSIPCKAQIIDDLYLPNSDVASDEYYYKDLNNDLGRFEGTWLYTIGNTSFEMILVKKERLHITGEGDNYFTDALVGGYRYVVNGNEIINTLTSINQDLNNVYGYYIGGDDISRPGDSFCHDCADSNQRKIYGIYSQPNCNIAPPNRYTLRYFTDNGTEKIEVVFYQSGPIHGNFDPNDTTEPDCPEYLVPFGTYVFTKQ